MANKDMFHTDIQCHICRECILHKENKLKQNYEQVKYFSSNDRWNFQTEISSAEDLISPT